MARWNSCNVLEVGAAERHVWQFDARNQTFSLGREQTAKFGEPLPEGIVARDWRSLFQPKLNVAWLPPENVFLRAAQFPQSTPEETRSMVEFQLEKLSPIPVTQAVWTFHVLPHAEGGQQTVVVTIVARSVVEEFLGQLEGQGYLANRIEVPVLDQLQMGAGKNDGAYVYPGALGGKNAALVAWWEKGVLHNLDLLQLHTTVDPAATLRDQLTQMIWAGELEGWLKTAPEWHLVAEGTEAAQWEAPLRQATEQAVKVTAPLAPAELAARTAKRAVESDPTSGLMPPEFNTRYEQQFWDRLWMRGLFAVIGMYIVGLAIYFVAVEFMSIKTGKAEDLVRDQSLTYTNAQQTIARYDVLKRREELKNAALDSLLLCAANLPDDLSLDSFNFSEGQHVKYAGSASADGGPSALGFYDAIRKGKINDKDFFTSSGSDDYQFRVMGTQRAQWDFGLQLARTEDLK